VVVDVDARTVAIDASLLAGPIAGAFSGLLVPGFRRGILWRTLV
jgi:hypothetical protein